MTDLREELARAICFEDTGRITAYDVWEKSLGDTQRAMYLRMADAVLPIVARAVAAEREQCAAILDEHYKPHENGGKTGYHEGARDALDIAAQAIRARGGK